MPPVRKLLHLRRLGWQLLLVLLLAGPVLSGCRLFKPYRLPTPQIPVAKQVKAKKKDPGAAEMADGSTGDTKAEPPKLQKNSYDKNGLLKKPKYNRRKLKKKVGQRRIFGITLPF